jgi:hypothetical protein
VGGSGVTVIALGFLATITYDSNTAASGAPSILNQSQQSIGESFTVSAQGTLTKPGLHFQAGIQRQMDLELTSLKEVTLLHKDQLDYLHSGTILLPTMEMEILPQLTLFQIQ